MGSPHSLLSDLVDPSRQLVRGPSNLREQVSEYEDSRIECTEPSSAKSPGRRWSQPPCPAALYFNDGSKRATFDQIRPHEALDDATPDSAYRSALMNLPETSRSAYRVRPSTSEHPKGLVTKRRQTVGGSLDRTSSLGNEFIGLREPIGSHRAP